MSEPIVIAELDDTPVGTYGLRKRLTKTEEADGTVSYSIREYAPRPVRINAVEESETYVPARGIDLTEDELRSICTALRYQLYDVRHVNDHSIVDDPVDLDDFDDDDEDDDDDSEEGYDDSEDDEASAEYLDSDEDEPDDLHEEMLLEDPIDDEDYEFEIGLEVYMMIAYLPQENGFTKELNLVSWHGRDLTYDLREYHKKVNSRGFIEMTPEIDKGLTLDDYESEMLCQAIEELFPDILAETAEYREDDFMDKLDIFHIQLTDSEHELCASTVNSYLNRVLVQNLLRSERGSEIGKKEDLDFSDDLTVLRRKVTINERMSDAEYELLVRVLREETAYHEDSEEDKLTLNSLTDKIETVLVRRGRQGTFDSRMREMRMMSLAAGECRTAADILRLIYDHLYADEPANMDKELLSHIIDGLAIEDIVTRSSNRVSMTDNYKRDPGKRFMLDLIFAFEHLGYDSSQN